MSRPKAASLNTVWPISPLINICILRLGASEALLYICCKLPFVSIECPTSLLVKTNARRGTFLKQKAMNSPLLNLTADVNKITFNFIIT